MADKNISLTEGPASVSLVRFALPVLGALVLQAAYGAVDLLVVGRFGDASSIAAVGTASAFMQLLTFVITSLAMGITVVIGHHIGEGRGDLAGDTVVASAVMFAAFGVILTVALEVFAKDIASLLRVPAESHAKAVVYLRICCGGTLIIIFYNVISAVMRGIGDAKLPLLFVAIACAVNVAGDLLLTGLLGMDVAGVAIATVFAQFVSVAASLAVLARRRLPFMFSPRPAHERCGAEAISARWDTARHPGDDGAGVIPRCQHDSERHGAAAIRRLWRRAEGRFRHYALPLVDNAERFCVRRAEHRRRTRRQGGGWIPRGGCDRLRIGRVHVLCWIFLRRRAFVSFHGGRRSCCGERGISQGLLSGMCADMHPFQRDRIFQRARQRASGDGAGDAVGAVRPHPTLYVFLRTS